MTMKSNRVQVIDDTKPCKKPRKYEPRPVSFKRVLDYSEVEFTTGHLDVVIKGVELAPFKRTRRYHFSKKAHPIKQKPKSPQTKDQFLQQKAFEMRINRTFSEARLWREIARYQLLGLAFKSQVPMGDFICDFVCPELKLVIEIDGKQHIKDSKVIAQDKRKTKYLKSLGYSVIRFSNGQINFKLNQTLAYLWDRCAQQLTLDHTTNTKLSGAKKAKTQELIQNGNPYHNKVDQYRLCELVTLTGIPKSTIQYYRSKGLLYTVHEQSDRGKIPTHYIQHYTKEHLEKLRHIHSLRARDQMPARTIFYTFRCIEEAIAQAKNPVVLTPQQLKILLHNTEQGFYVPPKQRVLLRRLAPDKSLEYYPSATIPRNHIFSELNPYGNTAAGELKKLAVHQQYTQQLATLLREERRQTQTSRRISALGPEFELLMQFIYEQSPMRLVSLLANA
jgi:very-short-patch-repair endonuclease